ncbi:hypothetical protein [Psychrobacter urativorans]|uniref:hypothetical protein n=1 Tax=Psychrobacter urativorans TaxID=45610 RepID=UPI000AE15E4D|nr:hypothetical protein [Psychrobacter urativorans]
MIFNLTTLATKYILQRLPSRAVYSALLLIAAVPVTHAASVNKSNASDILVVRSIRAAAHCPSDGVRDVKTLSPQQSSQQRTIDCMLMQLQVYQQDDKSARQHYLAYKAQAWLNYAYHKDSIKSRSAAGSQALQAGSLLLAALQNGTDEQLSITTDIPTTSALMRPDLWATLNALKDSGGISAAPRELAFSEVALVWAAADQCEHGWRQSGTHFRMADRWLEQAREAYVNAHDSETNVELESLINRYFKQYTPLDTGDDICRGQKMDSHKLYISQTITIPMPVPTATYNVVY